MDIGIYGLIDPITKELRYIGLSKNIQVRYSQHCSHSASTKGSYLLNWLNNLQSKNLKPELIILEVCKEKDLSENEIFWISYFKSLGCNLVNLTSGGENFNHSIITKNKISETLLGHQVKEETKVKIRLARAKQVINPMSNEQKQKISLIHKGKPKSKEHREKLSLIQKGKKRGPYKKRTP